MSWDAVAFDRRLAAAVDVYDRVDVNGLCEELIDHLYTTDQPYPVAHARAVLRQLRRKRWFDLVTGVGDVMLQAGQRHPWVRCEYAQALTDQGRPGAAAELLTGVCAESTDEAVRAEATGMLGRAYKQMSLASAAGSSRQAALLRRAIHTYAAMYEADPDRHAWHGVNAAALLRYAERNGMEMSAPFDPTSIGRRVLGEVEGRFHSVDGATDAWHAALAAEAGLILDMPEQALLWTQRYAADGRADAFELGSTLRQFTEVWQLDGASEPGSLILPILNAQILMRREGGSVELAAADVGTGATSAPDEGLEKVLGDAGVVTHSWYQQGLRRGRAVALIRHRSGRAVGTGFLLRAADLSEAWSPHGAVVVTNSHVVSPERIAEDSLTPDQAVVSFQAAGRNGSGSLDIPVAESLWSSPPRSLDCTVLRLRNGDIDIDIEPCPITPFRPRLDGKQRVYVIGHPEGRELSYSIDDNLLLDYDDAVIHYRAPTEHGSSGSPVFNRDWEVMGLHHAGRTDMPRLHGREGTYPANEGIWLQAVVSAIEDA